MFVGILNVTKGNAINYPIYESTHKHLRIIGNAINHPYMLLWLEPQNILLFILQVCLYIHICGCFIIISRLIYNFISLLLENNCDPNTWQNNTHRHTHTLLLSHNISTSWILCVPSRSYGAIFGFASAVTSSCTCFCRQNVQFRVVHRHHHVCVRLCL